MQTVMPMRGTGRKTELMGMENIIILMGPSMKANGKKMNKQAKAKRSGQMGQCMRAIIDMGKSKARVSSFGQMGLNMLGSLIIIVLKDLASIYG